jgi:hypothetical protein
MGDFRIPVDTQTKAVELKIVNLQLKNFSDPGCKNQPCCSRLPKLVNKL